MREGVGLSLHATFLRTYHSVGFMTTRTIVTLMLLTLSPLAGQDAGTASLQGKVVRDGGNQPIADARVTAQNMRTNALVFATTDAAGAFTVNGLVPGAYRVSFAARGFVPHVYGSRVPNGTWTPVHVEAGQLLKGLAAHLTAGGGIEGRVRDTRGLPAVDSPVSLMRFGYNTEGKKILTVVSSVLADDRGDYRFFWIPPGRYYLRVGGRVGFSARVDRGLPLQTFGELFYPAAASVDAAVPIDVLAGADILGMDFRLPRQNLLRIRGRVIDAQTGRSPGNASISIIGDNWSSGGGNSYRQSDGTFELTDLWPGEYKIIASMNGPETEGGGRRPVSASEFIPVRLVDKDIENVILQILPPVGLTGRAVFEGNGFLPAGLTLRVHNINARLTGPLPNTLLGPIAQDGSFRIQQIVSGNYALETSAPEFYVKRARYGGTDASGQPLRLDAGDGSTPLEVVLAYNVAGVTVRVRDAALRPAVGAQVVLVPDSGRHRRNAFRQGLTDLLGEYSFSNVLPGDYKLYAWEAIESGSWRDPDVLKKFDRSASPVRVTELSGQDIAVTLIPAEVP
jgi:hypothetical protein